MKTVVVALCLAFFLSPARGQLMEVIMNVGIPCALEIGVSGSDIQAIQSGNLEGATDLWNCFADCASKMAGTVSADYKFLPDAFKERLALFVVPERVDEFMEKCSDKIGEGKCKASGELYRCIFNLVLENIFA